MRSLLVDTQAIASALVIEDMDSVEKYAKPLGMAMKKCQGCHESYRIEAKETIKN